jgi:universal stress protein F
VVIGDPRDEILDTAKEIGADLIILGSAGKGRTKRFLLGSVSTSVVTESPIATLVTHASHGT